MKQLHIIKTLPIFCFLLCVLGCNTKQVSQASHQYSIVSLSPSTTEIIAECQKEDILVGRTEYCNYPTQIKSLESVASVKPHYEKIAAIKPSLIVFDNNLYNNSDKIKLTELKIDIFPMTSQTLDDFVTTLKNLNRTTQGRVDTSSYIDRIDEALSNIHNFKKRVSAAIILHRGRKGTYLIAGNKTLPGDILYQLGVDLIGPNGRLFIEPKIEKLLVQNPEVIFTAQDPSLFYQDNRLKNLKAIVNRRVYRIDADILLRPGARVDKLIKIFYNRLLDINGSRLS